MVNATPRLIYRRERAHSSYRRLGGSQGSSERVRITGNLLSQLGLETRTVQSVDRRYTDDTTQAPGCYALSRSIAFRKARVFSTTLIEVITMCYKILT